jgi:hypothetical protein
MHDANTCAPCDAIDGTSFGYSDDPAAQAAARAAYPAGGYALCAGGTRCRGTVYGRYPPPGGAGNRAGPAAGRTQAATRVFEDARPASTHDMTALLRQVLSDGYVPVQTAGRR